MKNRKFKKNIDRFVIFCLVALVVWGASRVYYDVTGGFRIGKISSTLTYNPDFETRTLSTIEKQNLDVILSQPFTYLGKGCQSYVFGSEDGKYVIKFVKFQHFRPQPWINTFTFIPSVEVYRQKKIEKKNRLLANFFKSWILAFEELPDQTGVVYLHLNKTQGLHKPLLIFDKIGLKHTLDLDNLEFVVQKQAVMLKEAIHEGVKQGNVDQTKLLLTHLVDLMVEEHKSGYTDRDHALLQNTGVIMGKPVHVDVGQIVKDQSIRSAFVYHQEMFNKTWRFRIWLEKNYPELLSHLNQELHRVMGDKFYTMKYYPKLK